MSTTTTTSAQAPQTGTPLSRAIKHKAKRAGKKKLVAKLRADKEFAKAYFEARSKRSTEKKSTFRKKKSKKK